MPGISVVIPALDEESLIEEAILSVREAEEVIVVDGGSRDRTRDRAKAVGARVLTAVRGRGPQLDGGARECKGDWLVFLHADTRLEPGWTAELRAVSDRFVGGAFRFAVRSERPAFRVIEAGVRLRCVLFHLPYGDQALFARREAYAACGGFPPLPFMEDLAFVGRLRAFGPLALLRKRAFTSPRRWEAEGVVRTTAHHLWLLTRYAGGWRPQAVREDRP